MKKDIKFEKYAIEKLKKIQKILLLEDFYPLKIEPSKSRASESEFSYPYKSINIRYSQDLLDDFKKKDFVSVNAVLVHEMFHPVTDGLYSKATDRYVTKNEIEDERERLTDHLANIISKLVKI